MVGKSLRQWAYALGLAALVALAVGAAPGELALPPLPVLVGTVALTLLTWHRGFATRYLGLLSLERVPQIAVLLAFGPIPGALANGLSSLIFPFTNRGYRQGSLVVGAQRAVHNAAMSTLMGLAGGLVYLALGGAVPFAEPAAASLLPIAGMALAMQAVNILLMAAWLAIDGRDARRVITPTYALVDLAFVPLGVLTGSLYATVGGAAFLLYLAMLVAFILTLHTVVRTRAELETRVEALDKVAQAGRAVTGAGRIDQVAERILRQVGAMFRYDEFYLVFVDEGSGELDIRLHIRDGERLPPRRKTAGAGLFGWVAQRGEPLLVNDWREAPEEARSRAVPTALDPLSVMVVPMRHAGRTVGLLSIQHREPRVWSDADLNLITAIADQIAPALSDARLFEELVDGRQRLEERVAERTAELAAASAELRAKSMLLERQSKEDALTGLANRRHLDEQVDAELARAARFSHPLSVVLADLDHFKSINDRFGHALGDEVLRTAAALLRRHCRGIDVVARWGGEEFALLLPETDAAGARTLCEKIRQAFAEHPWDLLAPGLRVTISIGLFETRAGMDGASAFERADEHLYQAKRDGRDRVVG
jgi:diguanylate cyclase (GGDEF)-like protein